MKKTVLKIVLWIAVLAMAALIFFFSAQDATQSNHTSTGFSRFFLGLVIPNFNGMTPVEQVVLIERIMTPIRKCAHFFIFSALGFWLTFLIRQYRSKAVPIMAVGVACLYAVSDEFHQYFVPGRACQLRDVCIDTAGAVLGALIALLFALIWQKLRKRHIKAG